MTFGKIFRYITDRPFLMALIIFVVAFVLYQYVFKNKSAASTVASTALPTSGRGTIYNIEYNVPAGGGPNIPPPSPIGTPIVAPTTGITDTRTANGKDDTLQGFSSYFGTPIARMRDLNRTLYQQYGDNGVLPAGTSVVVMSV